MNVPVHSYYTLAICSGWSKVLRKAAPPPFIAKTHIFLRRKFSWKTKNPRNSRKFSPLKITRYTVLPIATTYQKSTRTKVISWSKELAAIAMWLKLCPFHWPCFLLNFSFKEGPSPYMHYDFFLRCCVFIVEPVFI